MIFNGFKGILVFSLANAFTPQIDCTLLSAESPMPDPWISRHSNIMKIACDHNFSEKKQVTFTPGYSGVTYKFFCILPYPPVMFKSMGNKVADRVNRKKEGFDLLFK